MEIGGWQGCYGIIDGKRGVAVCGIARRKVCGEDGMGGLGYGNREWRRWVVCRCVCMGKWWALTSSGCHTYMNVCFGVSL